MPAGQSPWPPAGIRPDLGPSGCGRHGVAETVRPPAGMQLGAFDDAEFGSRRLHLRPGETLLLYSDGLTEARPGGEFFGEECLARFAGHRAGSHADELINDFDPAPADDIALLAIRVPTG